MIQFQETTRERGKIDSTDNDGLGNSFLKPSASTWTFLMQYFEWKVSIIKRIARGMAMRQSKKGVPNLHKVSDTLYRSGQPSEEGMRNLKAEGIKTIINLRSFHSDRDEIGDTGLAYEHIHMKASHPEEEEAVRFLQIVTNPKRNPVLVHCQRGADRTGTMCAFYRIAVQGWTKGEAIREMTEGGFGFDEIWKNLRNWLENVDIEAIKKKAGMMSSTEQRNS